MSRTLPGETDAATQQARVGVQAPDFTLVNERGERWRLADKRGRVVALLFYPANETLVCTKQLCAVRDNWASFIATGAEVVGISPGTPQAHQDFAKHHNLPLSLLADTDAVVTRQYTSLWRLPWWTMRSLVVIDAKGLLRFRKVMLRIFRPHNDEVIAAIRLAQYDHLINRSD
jgi:peroxiredoxin Q/BCP